MKKKSYAKINLTLDVIEKRQDGYHNIDGIMQMIDLYDEVEVKISDEFKITSNSKDIPLDENNLVYKAYLAMKDKYKFRENFLIHIEKNIPVSAGIAGGSTNSAVVIEMIDEILGLNMSLDDKKQIGKSVGADIPYSFKFLIPRLIFYHKIGYLIASGTHSLQELSDCSKDKTKEAFRHSLDGFIKDSIKIEGNYSDLSYENQSDRERIARLLLLFNVESVRRHGAHSQWFPFDKHKFGKDGKVSWSLEHIHAQQSERIGAVIVYYRRYCSLS